MEDQTSLIETLFETQQYTRTAAELHKLKAIDKAADVISTLAARLAVIVIFALFFLIMNIGFSLWIGEALGRYFLGFFVVAGFYVILGLLFYVFRKVWVKEPLRNSIIEQALKEG